MKKKPSAISSIKRLFNLSAYLMTVSRPVTLRCIISEVEGYGGADFESERRKFLRDKNELKKLGINIRVAGDTGPAVLRETEGYIIDKKEMFLPDINFTADEINALASLKAWAVSGNILFDELDLAMAKLAAASQTTFGDSSLLVQMSGDKQKINQKTLKALREAVLSRRRIAISYKSSGAKTEDRRDVDPYGLFLRRGTWYLLGFCHKRRAERTFRLDRLSLLNIHDNPNGEADFELPDGFSISKELKRRAPWEFGEERATTATIKFKAGIFWQVRNSWGDLASARFDESSLTMTVDSINNEALLHWVLEFADEAEIVSPPELRRNISAILEGIINSAGTVV